MKYVSQLIMKWVNIIKLFMMMELIGQVRNCLNYIGNNKIYYYKIFFELIL